MSNVADTDVGWIPFSELRIIDKDISEYGYCREYVDAHGLKESNNCHRANAAGAACYFEEMEIRLINHALFWRENEHPSHRSETDHFVTQYGTFANHNRGEFFSWLGKRGELSEDIISKEEIRIQKQFGREDFYIEGNFCDMFDCGKYTYAVSNLLHLGSGDFKIVRIDENFKYITLFDTDSFHDWTALEYCGYVFKDDFAFLVVSGYLPPIEKKECSTMDHKTFLFKIKSDGTMYTEKEWDFALPSTNSVAFMNDEFYFGNNKMITRFNPNTGKLTYYTNKDDETLRAMVKL